MCDEDDDERTRAFWRMLAERDGLVPLNVMEAEDADTIVKPIALEPASKLKPRPLAR